MNSLERRLQIGLGVSLMILMLLLGWLLQSTIKQMTVPFVSSRLTHDAESLLAALQVSVGNSVTLSNNRIGGIYEQPLSGHYYTILIPGNETLRSRSLWDTELDVAPLSPGNSHLWHTAGPAGQTLLIKSAGFLKQDIPITIAVAEDMSPLRAQMRNYTLIFTLLTLGLIAVLIMIQRKIIRRSFSPLDQLREEIHKLEQGQIDTLTEEVPTEVRPLVTEVNRLLELMGQRLQRSRNALGNLAHALKGPLNLLTQIADNETVSTQPALRDELTEHTQTLRRLIEHELKRARLAGSGGPGQHFCPAEELPALAELLQRLYDNKGLTIDYSYPKGVLGETDRDDMLELIGNLADNACKWAASRVRCTVQGNDTITISVEDDGPGCSEAQLAALTRRGKRLDESVPGHGLGLAIVDDIVTLYHGELHFDRSPDLGGLRVRIKLPALVRTSG